MSEQRWNRSTRREHFNSYWEDEKERAKELRKWSLSASSERSILETKKEACFKEEGMINHANALRDQKKK